MVVLVQRVNPKRLKWDWSSRGTAALFPTEPKDQPCYEVITWNLPTTAFRLSKPKPSPHRVHISAQTYGNAVRALREDSVEISSSEDVRLPSSDRELNNNVRAFLQPQRLSPGSTDEPKQLFLRITVKFQLTNRVRDSFIIGRNWRWNVDFGQTSCIWESGKNVVFPYKLGAMPQVTFFPGKSGISGAVDQFTPMPGLCFSVSAPPSSKLQLIWASTEEKHSYSYSLVAADPPQSFPELSELINRLISVQTSSLTRIPWITAETLWFSGNIRTQLTVSDDTHPPAGPEMFLF